MKTIIIIIIITFLFMTLGTSLVNAQEFIRGDSNSDGIVDLSDAIFSLNSLFLGQGKILCQDAADANDDGILDLSDPVYTLNYLFIGGDKPSAPYPNAGVDPTLDDLSCEIACVDECPSRASVRECRLIGSQSCGDFDSDECLEWQDSCPTWITTPNLFIREHEHEEPFLIFSDTTLPIGQIFELEVEAAGIESSIRNARIDVIISEQVIDSIDLSCNFKSNEDSSQEYYKCIGRWDSRNVNEGENLYKFNAFIEDNLGEVHSSLTREHNLVFVTVDISLCEELIPDHNNPEEDRANIVFVGFGYEGYGESPQEILNLIGEYLIDLNGNNFGLFSVEPFKSNKEKFNMWYVNELESTDTCQAMSCNNFILSASCQFDNKYVIHVIDKVFPHTHSTGRIQLSLDIYPSSLYEYYCGDNELSRIRISCHDGCNKESGICNSEDYLITDHLVSTRALSCTDSDVTQEFPNGINPLEQGTVNYENIFGRLTSRSDGCRGGVVITESGLQIEPISPRTFVHEFGHLFAGLRDEYRKPNPGEDELATYANCYLGETRNAENCLENAPWKDFIGDGCGEDGIIDCTFRDENYRLEVACYEGCTFGPGSGMYRSTETNLMRSHGIDPFSFGKWNEKLIQDELDKFS
jgi:hypothetical protein